MENSIPGNAADTYIRRNKAVEDEEICIDKSILNDGLNTYMVISGITVDIGCFEVGMLKNNDISSILSFEFRQLDDKQMIFFDINGLETMTDIIPHMTAESILKFIRTVGELAFELEDYMLNPGDLIIETKYIYYDGKKGEYRFAYVKGYDQPVAKQLRGLLEDVLQNVFHRDKEGLNIVYDLYNIVAFDKVDMKEILNYVKEYSKNNSQTHKQVNSDNAYKRTEDVYSAGIEENDRRRLMDEVFSNNDTLNDKILNDKILSGKTVIGKKSRDKTMGGKKSRDKTISDKKLSDKKLSSDTMDSKTENNDGRKLRLDYYGLLKTGIIITGIAGMLLASVQFLGNGNTEYIRALMCTVLLMAAEVAVYTGMKRREVTPLLQAAGNSNAASNSGSDRFGGDISKDNIGAGSCYGHDKVLKIAKSSYGHGTGTEIDVRAYGHGTGTEIDARAYGHGTGTEIDVSDYGHGIDTKSVGKDNDYGTVVLAGGQLDVGTTLLTEHREMYLESLEVDGSGDIRNCGKVMTVGRSNSSCDHVIDDGGVSRRHAELIWQDSWIDVIDLGSTNGTKVNNIELAPGEAAHVKAGDVVAFGDVKYLCRNQ